MLSAGEYGVVNCDNLHKTTVGIILRLSQPDVEHILDNVPDHLRHTISSMGCPLDNVLALRDELIKQEYAKKHGVDDAPVGNLSPANCLKTILKLPVSELALLSQENPLWLKTLIVNGSMVCKKLLKLHQRYPNQLKYVATAWQAQSLADVSNEMLDHNVNLRTEIRKLRSEKKALEEAILQSDLSANENGMNADSSSDDIEVNERKRRRKSAHEGPPTAQNERARAPQVIESGTVTISFN